jgi:tripartite-type tricarboxylate transporter receptor subunit TctC
MATFVADVAEASEAVAAVKRAPVEMVDKLNNEFNSGLGDPSVTARLAALGSSAFPVSPSDFGRFIAAETDKWAKVIKAAGIKGSEERAKPNAAGNVRS